MFASVEPVAIDQACADACNRMPVIPGSLLHEHIDRNVSDSEDYFTMISPNTDWQVGLEHAEKIGLGSRKYELIEVK
jgi:uncharacterized Fe-S center protein